jgi:hypothetical protein
VAQAPVRQQVRDQHDERHQAGQCEAAGQLQRALSRPCFGTDGEGGRESDRGDDEEIERRQRLKDEPRRKRHRVTRARIDQQSIECQQRERQELDVQRLHVRHPREGVGVESEHDAAGQAGPPVAGPADQHEARRPSGQRKPCDQQDVVGENRRRSGPDQRCPHRRLYEQRL